MIRVAILGATGSIGTSALAVADAHPDRVRIVGLAAGQNVTPMAAAVQRHRPMAVSMSTADALARLGAAAGGLPSTTGVGAGFLPNSAHNAMPKSSNPKPPAPIAHAGTGTLFCARCLIVGASDVAPASMVGAAST